MESVIESRAGLSRRLLLTVALPPVGALLGLALPPNVVFPPLAQAWLLLGTAQLKPAVHVVGARHAQARRRLCGKRRLVLVLFFVLCVVVRTAFVLPLTSDNDDLPVQSNARLA